MPHLNEVDFSAALESSEDAVDAIAGIAVNTLHAPLDQTLNEKIAHIHERLVPGAAVRKQLRHSVKAWVQRLFAAVNQSTIAGVHLRNIAGSTFSTIIRRRVRRY